MAEYTVPQAAAAVGRNRSSILRAIRNGKISAVRDEASGDWRIDPAELHRLYPPQPEMRAPEAFGRDAPSRTNGASVEIADLRARLRAAEDAVQVHAETICDLRARLDVTAQHLGEALQQIKLLADQRVPPSRPTVPEPPPRSAWQRFLTWRR